VFLPEPVMLFNIFSKHGDIFDRIGTCLPLLWLENKTTSLTWK
jgi:hypothetical protein